MINVVENVMSFMKSRLLSDERPILVAFSGGFDSMCLLHVLVSNGQKNVIAIHLNHNWRGEESWREEENCRKFCNNFGIKFYSELLPDNTPKTENEGRKARYAFFEKCYENFGAKAVLTAHNADDNAETLIYRLAKGTGLDGLCGIPEVRGIFFRPLLTVSRADIEEYCRQNGLTPNNDSSNEDTKYKRNLIRKKVLPLLKEINPDVVCAINSLSDLAKKDFEYFENCLKENETGETQGFCGLPYSIQSRIIKKMLTEFAPEYDRKKIDDIINFIKENSSSKSGKTYSITKGTDLFVNDKFFDVIKNSAKNLEEIKITSEGSWGFGDKIFVIEKTASATEKSAVTPEKFPKDSEKIAYVELDGIDFTLRTRRAGDVIQPFGMKGRQKLKKYFNEKKIPSYKKDEIPLITKGWEVLWAAGVGMSEKIRVKNRATHVLRLIKKNKERTQ